MMSKVKEWLGSKVLSVTTISKALSGNIDRTAIANAVRDEASSVVKGTVFHYFIWMNLLFGAVGFILGCVVMWLIC